MRRHDRHPVFEFVVFGTALVLAVVLAFYSWQRFRPAPPAEPQPVAQDFEPAEVTHAVPARGDLQQSGTVRAVAYIPPSQASLGPPRAKKIKKVYVP